MRISLHLFNLQFMSTMICNSKLQLCNFHIRRQILCAKRSNNEKRARNLLQGFNICPHVIAMCHTYF